MFRRSYEKIYNVMYLSNPVKDLKPIDFSNKKLNINKYFWDINFLNLDNCIYL